LAPKYNVDPEIIDVGFRFRYSTITADFKGTVTMKKRQAIQICLDDIDKKIWTSVFDENIHPVLDSEITKV